MKFVSFRQRCAGRLFCEGAGRGGHSAIQPRKRRAHGGGATGKRDSETQFENASMVSGC